MLHNTEVNALSASSIVTNEQLYPMSDDTFDSLPSLRNKVYSDVRTTQYKTVQRLTGKLVTMNSSIIETVLNETIGVLQQLSTFK